VQGHNLFCKHRLHDLLRDTEQQAIEKIRKYDKDYLLSVSEADLCEHVVSVYQFDPPVLRREEMCVLPTEEVDVDVRHDWRRMGLDLSQAVYVEGTCVNVVVPFDGEAELFDYVPSSFSNVQPRAKIVGQELHLSYIVTNHDAESLRREIDRDISLIESYLHWLRKDVGTYNETLPQTVEKAVKRRKEKLLGDEGLVSSLGIPMRRRPEESLTFRAPEIRRKPIIRQPQAPAQGFKPEPTLPEEEYQYILKVIESMVQTMERSPRAFARMGEEDLRDVILVQLNGHYEGQATGETFNCQGKTDILIRSDGRNVFIAECMFWDGPKSLRQKLDQLLGYTSWRDTKCAVVVFSKRRDFSAVIDSVRDTVPQHACCKRARGQRGETRFEYVFHQPGDANREISLTVLVFNVPSGQADSVTNGADGQSRNRQPYEHRERGV
jgi:hypothetical protein